MSAECVVCGPVALLKVGVLGESLGAVLPAADASEFKGSSDGIIRRGWM